MMSSAARYLSCCESFSKLVTVASEVVWPDECMCFGFCPTKNCCITCGPNYNDKRLQSISREIWIDERQKFADVVSISYQVNFFMLYEGFSVYSERKGGSSGLSG
jgi:hypothetical protein